MATVSIAPAPVIVALSNLKNKEDLLGNEVIEAVVRVFFPTMERLQATLAPILREQPTPQIKIFTQSHIDVMAVAKTVMFSIGAEATKLIALEELKVREEIDELAETSEEREPDPFLYPVIYALSEPTTQRGEGVQIVQSTLSIHLTSMDNLAASEEVIRRSDPKTEIQTHFRCNRETALTVAEFILDSQANLHAKQTGRSIGGEDLTASVRSTGSILSGDFQEQYFSVEEPPG